MFSVPRLLGFVLVVSFACAEPYPPIPLLERQGDFHGFRQYLGQMEGREVRLVVPGRAAEGRPWIWRARFWGHEPQTDVALLNRGFHVAYCDAAELFGNDRSLALWDRWYGLLREAGLSPKAAMEGMSRGGFYVYRWAARYPERVSCVYADAPVLDIRSWPGKGGRGGGDEASWRAFLEDFGYKSDEEARAFKGSPLDLVPEIVKGGFPILHVCGAADEVVPIEENTDLFEARVKAAGGRITVIRKPGVGHHPHSLADPGPIVDFILAATGKAELRPTNRRVR